MSRKVTSAIEGFSVADVRRGLDTVRTLWANRNENTFYLTKGAIDDITVGEFSTMFVKGQHRKRHDKAKRLPPQTTRRVTRSQTRG